MSKGGKVWLAGAGPGDAGLLTVKTRKLLEEADVIVYDALISAEILSLIPEQKELIHVGKRSGNHPIPQHEINKILLCEAQKGKQVLRLKGGDPFVFGRGGEELELLTRHGIPYEIVPGITAAVAVPAYAGIPVTHRDYTSSFHVITGHARADGTLDIDYPSLVKLNGTLVFLMGIASMPAICQGLLVAGMSGETPAAILEKGTLAAQRSVISTVAELVIDAGKAGITTPAIILVGAVCALAERFHWSEDRPLGGRQFLITRPREHSSKLAEHLRALGAQVIELPAIVTKPLVQNARLDDILARFGQQTQEEWLVYTSPVGVKIFFEKLMEKKIDIRQLFCGPAIVKIAAIGSATAQELKSYGILADLIPAAFCAESLGKEIAAVAAPGSQITIVRAAAGSETLIPPLEQAGLEIEDIPLYETVYQTHDQLKEKLKQMFTGHEIDGVTFTSASTVEGFNRIFPDLEKNGIQAFCIGEQTAAAARQLDMQIAVAKTATIESMVELILEKYGN